MSLAVEAGASYGEAWSMSLYDLDLFIKGRNAYEERQANLYHVGLAKATALIVNTLGAANGANRELTNPDALYKAWTGQGQKSMKERWAASMAAHEERMKYEKELIANGTKSEQ